MPESDRRWLYGPAPDLLLGCGLGYMAFFVVILVAGPGLHSLLPLGLLPLASVFAGTPHYGATLLRVYEDGAERRRYAFFAVWLTLVIWGLYALGLYWGALGSVLLTVYLTWSPWHYTGQNYGIALMFLRRRGVEITPRTKRAIYASFLLSFCLTLLAIHGSADAQYYAPVASYGDSPYRFVALGVPSPWWQYGFALLGAAYLASLAVAARALLRVASARDLAPSAAIALTQLLWFSLPPLGRELGLFPQLHPFAPDFATFMIIWIAVGHAVQYLWITTFYAQGRGATPGAVARYYAKCVCAGSAIWSVPVLLYTWTGIAGSEWGGVARGGDAGILIAAAANLHHFVLDGAIWKLRDGRVARILIRREAAERPEPIGPRRRPYLAWAFLAAGALWTVSTVATLLEREYGLRRSVVRGDLSAASASLRRLELIRRASPAEYGLVATAAERLGNDALALATLRRSAERAPSAAAHVAAGRIVHRKAGPAAAVPHFEAALELEPENPQAIFQLGRARLAQGEVQQALPLLERAAAALPDDRRIALVLEHARRALE